MAIPSHATMVGLRFSPLDKAEEISVGPYVLTGGELPSMIMIDSISRQIAGVLGCQRQVPTNQHAACGAESDEKKRSAEADEGFHFAADVEPAECAQEDGWDDEALDHQGDEGQYGVAPPCFATTAGSALWKSRS